MYPSEQSTPTGKDGILMMNMQKRQTLSALYPIDLPAVLRLVRVHQWTKNGAVLAALVASGLFLHPASVMQAITAFFSFCLLSASVYVMNDIADVESDRSHPRKRYRPIASGAVSIPVAVAVAGAATLLAFALAAGLGLTFVATAGAYLALQVAYSFRLKHVPIVDLLAVAGGFVLRAVGGAAAIGVMPSPWLISGTFFLSLFLIVAKRRSEVASAGSGHRQVLKHYTLPFLDQMTTFSAALAVCAYLLYTAEMTVHQGRLLFGLTVPCVVYAIARYFMLMHADDGDAEDPARLLLKDTGMRSAALLFGLLFILASWR
jgi:4-hydroxybenzoate polyprenyltransferase